MTGRLAVRSRCRRLRARVDRWRRPWLYDIDAFILRFGPGIESGVSEQRKAALRFLRQRAALKADNSGWITK